MKRAHSPTRMVLTLSALMMCCALVAMLAQPIAVAAIPSGFVYPLMGTRISSDFGDRNHPIYHVKKHHNGLDLAAPRGAPIRAIRGGMVVFADPYAGYGNLIVVRHENGLTSHYGHCNSIEVSPGKSVKAGEILGTVGSTGKVTGPHLHFEIRSNGKPLDPELYIPGINEKAEG